MAEQGFVEESYDRVQTAFRSWGDELEKFQKQMDKRRKKFERDAQRRVKQVRSEFRKNPLVKRAEGIREDAEKQIENRFDDVLGFFQIATRADVQKLDRRLAKLTKRLKELEKTSSDA